MAEKKQKSQENKPSYSAKDIFVLEGLDPVRKRPGMYIGSTGVDGLHHLIWEVIDNSIDEAMAGHATFVRLRLLKDGIVEVTDNGRGIPVDPHPQTKKSALETVLSTLHAGGKFGGESYKVSGGLHGVGVSVVNALSEYLEAEVHRDGGIYIQEYERGKPKKPVKKIGKTDETGTRITFKADKEIFSEIRYDRKKIIDHLRQQAFLVKGMYIEIIDEREEIPFFHAFKFDGGLLSFLGYLNEFGDQVQNKPFYVNKEHDEIEVEVAFLYNNDAETQELSFANNIYTPDGGMHLTGFRTALTRVLNDFAREGNYIKDKEENLTGEDAREGIVAVVSVKIREPQFEGQTKARLGNPPARTAVESVVAEALKEFLEKNTQEGRAIIGKALLAAKARKAAKAAKDTVLRKGPFEGLTLPGKLADCTSRNPEESELFIVEGDSAGGSGKQGRDRRFQAILPLKGKILNVEKSRLDKMLANNEIKSIVIALGTAIGVDFTVEKIRYHKIIIMTDADVDGAHIRTLLLTLFFRYFRDAIDQGYIYIAQPPLYRIQQGKAFEYVYAEHDKDVILKQLRKEKGEELKGVSIQRYKGLGEMNANQLWETTMDPLTRRLKKVTIQDAQEADRIFDVLMGEKVAPRKHFIQSRATTVKNLDI